jgi:hypothetical protein
MSGELSALEAKVLGIARRLEACGIPYAVGGAIAYTYYGIPRQTTDIDVNVFLSDERGEETVGCLAELGVGSLVPNAAARMHREGQIRLDWAGTFVDLFFAYHELHDLCAKRARTVPFGDGSIRILSGEDLVVFKVIFNRPRDWDDIGRILMVQRERFDRSYVERWVGVILGEDDARLARFQQEADQYVAGA